MDPAPNDWGLPQPLPPGALPADIPRPIAQVLVNRGIDTAEKLRLLLRPSQQLPYNPLRLSGMDRALGRIYQAIQRGETVGVFGDFDVDGITGTAIVCEGLEAFGVPAVPYLPHRSEEGHGLSDQAVEYLTGQGVSLIITVDCGVTSLEETDKARQTGVDVIITDHHVPGDALPAAAAIINPNVPGSRYPFSQLCGAGIAFKLIQGVFQFHGQPLNPGMAELAALGTIADLVPVLDENRFLVQQGLEELKYTQRRGLQALYHAAGIAPDTLDAETVAFQIAPRLNAAGRMSHAEESLRLLITQSAGEAQELARRLEQLNGERRELTQLVFAEVCRRVEELADLPPILWAEDPNMTPGIAGLVAGRLVEKFHRPAVALTALEGGRLVASCRSVPQFNFIEALTACEDLFVRFGGHSQAAGFTVSGGRLPELRERLTALALGAVGAQETTPALVVDAELGLAEMGPELLDWLSQMEPFGVGNARPKFLIKNAQVTESRLVGQRQQHLRLRVRQSGGDRKAIAFNQADKWDPAMSHLDLVATVAVDSWNGVEETTLKVVDFRPFPG